MNASSCLIVYRPSHTGSRWNPGASLISATVQGYKETSWTLPLGGVLTLAYKWRVGRVAGGCGGASPSLRACRLLLLSDNVQANEVTMFPVPAFLSRARACGKAPALLGCACACCFLPALGCTVNCSQSLLFYFGSTPDFLSCTLCLARLSRRLRFPKL